MALVGGECPDAMYRSRGDCRGGRRDRQALNSAADAAHAPVATTTTKGWTGVTTTVATRISMRQSPWRSRFRPFAYVRGIG
jgi:hypothetical protein